jgi:hypothetical protein
MMGAVMTHTSAARAAEEIRFMAVNSSIPYKGAPTSSTWLRTTTTCGGIVISSPSIGANLAAKAGRRKGAPSDALVPVDLIERRIFLLRGHKVMLDSDLADLYQVLTKRLNEQVRRNAERFPDDFMFKLTLEEVTNLMSQFATSSLSHGGRRKPALAFTEHGVAMLSSVLRSERAVQVNIAIMRAFTRLREMLTGHGDLVRKLDALEKKYDNQFRIVFDAIRQLMEPPADISKKRIGFQTERDG